MITLGFSFAIPVGAVLTSTLVQGGFVPQGISALETMPWPEIGLTVGVFVGAWLIRRAGRQIISRTLENRVLQYR